MAVQEQNITEEDVLALHEDILDQNEEGVRVLIQEIQEDGGLISGLVSQEVELEPLASDHKLNHVPLTAVHRAALVGSTSILSFLLTHDGGTIDKDLRLRCNGFTPLHVAAAAGVTSVASYLAANGATVEATDAEGQTPMHTCAKFGQIDVAKILCVKSASVTSQDRDGRTPLHFAAEQGHVRFAAFLVQKGASCDAQSALGQAPLHFAQQQWHKDVTELLLSHGADVDIQNKRGDSALHVAAQFLPENKQTTVSRESEKQQSDVERSDGVFVDRSDDSLGLLLAAKATVNLPNLQGRSPLHLAAKHDNIDVMSRLLHHDANVNLCDNDGNTPLCYCISLNALSLLLAAGADVAIRNKAGDSPCHIYSGSDDVSPKMLDMIIQRGSSANAFNGSQETPIFKACSSGDVAKGKVLLKAGASVSPVDKTGRSLLHACLLHPMGHALPFLLEQEGIPLDCQDLTGATALHVAASHSDLDSVRNLIRRGCQVNRLDDRGRTPAMVAMETCDAAVLRVLLRHGSRIQGSQEENPTSPLLDSARNDLETVSILLNQGLSPNCRNSKNQSPLHVAMESKSWDVARKLLPGTHSQKLLDQDLRSALHYACVYGGPVDLVCSIVEADPSSVDMQDSRGRTPVHYVMEDTSENSVCVLEVLLAHGCQLNVQDVATSSTPLHLGSRNLADRQVASIASVKLEAAFGEGASQLDVESADLDGRTVLHYVCCGVEDRVKLVKMVDGNVSVSDKAGATPLHYACAMGHLNIIEFLVNKGAELNVPDADGRTPLHMAVMSSKSDVTDFLLASGSDVNHRTKDGLSVLHVALDSGYNDLAEMILMNEPDVNLADFRKRRPLHVAAAKAPKHVIGALMALKPDVTSKDCTLRTALHYGVENRDTSVIRLLVTAGGDVNSVDANGSTPLHLAISAESYDHVNVLVTLGSEVDAKNNDGETPLHLAAALLETDLLEFLVANEADINAVDNEGLSPLMRALIQQNLDTAGLLLDQGADVHVTDKRGDTVLHQCARILDIKPSFVQTIVRKGLSPLKKNHANQSTLDIISSKQSEGKLDIYFHALGIED